MNTLSYIYIYIYTYIYIYIYNLLCVYNKLNNAGFSVDESLANIELYYFFFLYSWDRRLMANRISRNM